MINFFLFLSFLPWTSSSFSLKLIHRDSPFSPLYQPNITGLERFLKNAVISVARASHFDKTSQNQNVSIRLPARLENPIFTVEIGMGTPAVKRTLIFDTGSGITWTQCRPCIRCFKQNDPLFDAKRSSTYKPIGRKHPLAGGFTCTPFGCGYFIGYYSGQFSAGPAAAETFTFHTNLRAPATVSGLVFGCGTSNVGRYPPEVSGILAMDKEPTSFPRQLGSMIKGRFSYCLSPTTASYVRFGDEARIRGRNGQTTPFLNANTKRSAILYGLNLMDLSINGRKLGARFPEGCFIDSGSSLSLLNARAFVAVRDFVVSYFDRVRNVRRYAGNDALKKFLCYSNPAGGFAGFPSMTFHLKGADYHVPPSNLFFYVEGSVFCLAIMESRDVSILGAFQQRNVRIVYDLKEKMLSFAPEECSRDFQLGG
ncbi:aspartic proteinase CDR1-like [Salvia miltiorrhiza]|uniref:aspartic proteinase CDR1-like n=1 Tax=Salvia miltiorrhiza TaxID=226208 RepID=UPI0025AC9CA7|nr:aspartic proteinase CDR1-like [Salvia miltiorrhiza]